MDLRLSEEQTILCKSARSFLAERCPLDRLAEREFDPTADDPALWAEMANLGWLGLALPEDAGGSGGTLIDLELLCEELGRALCPAPFVPVAVAAAAALEAAGTAKARELVARIAAGEARPVLAVPDASGRWAPGETGARLSGGRVTGRKRFVEAAAIADLLLVTATAQDGEARLALVDPRGPGVTITPLPAMAGAQWSEIALEGAPAEPIGDWGAVEAALTRTAVMQAAWCAGAAARLLEDTVPYVSERRQFGVPIGSFQAVQHRLADCDITVAEAETLARQAAELLDSGSSDAKRMASCAFVRATDGFVQVARDCHQVWGGIGFCTEAHVHLFSRRAKVAQQSWGGTDYHLDVVAERMRGMPTLRDRYAAALAARGLSL